MRAPLPERSPAAGRTRHLSLSATPLWFASADDAPAPLQRIDAALLAWLAIEGPTPRARLAALLWPEADSNSARNTLRQRLFHLRRQFGDAIVSGEATLALADGVTHNLQDSDDVLADGGALPAGEFGHWLRQQRERRRARLRQSLAALADMAERANDFEDALTHSAELLALEPLSEEAHRRLIRLHYLRGDRAAALLAFDRCEQLLKDEVGARPSADTLALLASIDDSTAAAESGTAAALAVGGTSPPVSVIRPPRMIGRDAELAQLSAAWAAEQVVAVIGEAGIGKSRLLQDFAAARPGVLHVAARPGDAGVPLATLARLLRSVLALSTLTPALAPSQHGEIARVLPEFGDALAQRVSEGQRLMLQSAIQALLGLQTGLTGLLVDDLHFADEASLDMLRALVDEPASASAQRPTLRWALAYRPAGAATPLQSLQDGLIEQARLRTLPLQTLDVVALAELVDSLGLPGIDGSALAPGLMQRTGGNPLFVLETLKQAWVERSLEQVAASGKLPRPVSVGHLIERRIAQLSPGALALARVASIAGVDFEIGLAEHVLGVSAIRFADALGELEAAQVLRGDAFAHDLVFETVQASVPATIAAHTHSQVAAWLEHRQSEPARVARHWIAAGHPVRALPWLGRAADAAAAALRSKEQVAFLEHKSAIEQEAGQPDAAFATLMRAAEQQITIDGEDGKELALCDRLDVLATDDEQRIRARVQRAHMHHMRGEPVEAEQFARAALRDAMRGGAPPALVADCRHQLATALGGMRGHSAEAIVHFEAAIVWIDEHGDLSQQCEAHANLALTYDTCGRLADSVRHHKIGIDLSQRTGHQNNLAMTPANFAANRILGGHLRDGEELLARSRMVRAQADDPSSVDGFAAMLEAVCDYQSGRYRAALAALGTSEERLGRFAPGYRRAAKTHLAVCLAHLGQWARLQHLLAESGDAAEWAITTRMRDALLRHQMSLALHRRPDLERLRDALSLVQGDDLLDMQHAIQIELAAFAVPDDGLRELDRLIATAEALGFDSSMIAAHARAASIAADNGRVEPARRHAGAALELAQRSCMVRQYPGDLWLQCGQALATIGDANRASSVFMQGAQWVRATARDNVPQEFVDSFLQRNPVNAKLLAQAARASGAG